MSLTPKERVIAQIEHEETDHIPYVLNLDRDGDMEERLDAFFGSDTWRSLLDNAVRVLPIPSDGLLVDWTAEKYWTDLYGSTWRLDLRPYHLVQPALKEPSLDGFELPDVEDCFDADWEERARQQIKEQKDHFVVGILGCGLFERSWALRGFENALVDMAADPDFYEDLIDRLTDHHLGIVERLLELPVDGIFFSDDWGYQQGVLVGAERWRKIFKPRVARLYQPVHEAGKYVLSHCCGSIEEILLDVIEIGLDVYQSVQPEAKNNSPYELKRKYGDKITFWGGLGSQSTIPFGTPDEIRAEVARLCRQMGRGGGYILSPAKRLQPDTPTENVAAVLEAFLQQAGVPFPSST